MPLVTKGKDPSTSRAADQTWQEASVELWTDGDNLVNDLNLIWDYASQFYGATCAVCHRAHDPAEFTANQWMGQLKAMKQHAPMDKERVPPGPDLSADARRRYGRTGQALIRWLSRIP